MAIRYGVDVMEQCRVWPASGSVPNTSLSLTYFDIFWLSTSPVQRLFFYQGNHSKVHFLNTILPNIKHSLSLTLQHFFPLAGNVKWSQDSNKPEIIYSNGDSVSFTVAETDYDFQRLLSNQPRQVHEFLPLAPQLLSNEEASFPLLALQVTLFPNKGLCIGVTYHHAVADGRALLHFVKSWASICRSLGDTSFITESLPPCLDRSLIKDQNGIDMIFIEKLNTKEKLSVPRKIVAPPDDNVLGTFVVRPSDIKRIKQWILSLAENQNKKLHLSTFVLTCAYVWVCLIKAQRGEEVVSEEEEDSTECFGFPVDCRARLDPPVPLAYFGNCIRLCVAKGKGNDLVGKNGIVTAVELIGNAVPTTTDANAVLEDMKRLGFFDPPEKRKANGKFRLVGVAGSPKLGIYEIDFGWGNPKKAEVGSIANGGAISLCECPDENGAVEVGVVASKLEMEAFTSFFANTLGSFTSVSG